MKQAAQSFIFVVVGITAVLTVTAATSADNSQGWFMAGLATAFFVLIFVIQLMAAVTAKKEE